MAVAIDPAKRHEKGACGEGARVVRHTAHDHVGCAEHLAAGCGGDFIEPEGASVVWYRCGHRCARGIRIADLTVITCPDAA